MSRQSNRQLWKERIANYRSSGQPAALWCTSNQVNLNTLRSWISKLNKEAVFANEPVNWVSLKPTRILPSSSETNLLTITIGKANIKVAPGFDSNLLAEVVQVLTNLC